MHLVKPQAAGIHDKPNPRLGQYPVGNRPYNEEQKTIQERMQEFRMNHKRTRVERNNEHIKTNTTPKIKSRRERITKLRRREPKARRREEDSRERRHTHIHSEQRGELIKHQHALQNGATRTQSDIEERTTEARI